MASPEEKLLDVVRALPRAPVAIEASWDGDDVGWFVVLAAVVEEELGFRAALLATFRGGSDIRLISGEVPPWPEAQEAARVGQDLAAHLGVPFHFPSSEHPNDECPHWWERDQASPCRRCGVATLQKSSCRWQGVCYRCHLSEARERREASWLAEERAGSRCRLCGKPAQAAPHGAPRCATCLDRYEDYDCARCGARTCILKTLSHNELCSECELSKRLDQASQADKDAIRAAARDGVLAGADEARRLLGLQLPDALRAAETLSERRD